MNDTESTAHGSGSQPTNRHRRDDACSAIELDLRCRVESASLLTGFRGPAQTGGAPLLRSTGKVWNRASILPVRLDLLS